MFKVTFRKLPELLTDMFGTSFRSEKAVKAFIAKDAEFYANSHGFGENFKLENEEPNDADYFVLYRLCGVSRTPVLVYQYFRI